MQGHGRTDRETPVHLAYRIRQEFLDRSRQSDQKGAAGWGDMTPVTVGPFCIFGEWMDVWLRPMFLLQICPCVHTVVDWVKMILGFGSLPPERRHMQVKSRLANDWETGFMTMARCFSKAQYSFPEMLAGDQSSSGGLGYRIRCWKIIGTANVGNSRTRLGFIIHVSRSRAMICTTTDSVMVLM